MSLSNKERAACELVERMLRESRAYQVRLVPDLSGFVRVEVVRESVTYADLDLAAAIERARAARSKP